MIISLLCIFTWKAFSISLHRKKKYIMERKKTFELLSDKVIDTKGEELEKFLQKEKVEKEKEANQVSTTDYLNLPRMAFGIKGLAGILKVSTSTIARWRAEGILDDVTFNKGKYISFDVYGVLEILRESNHKTKFNRKQA